MRGTASLVACERRVIWTTATYVVMPAMVREGLRFGDAFSRSKAARWP
jgi:hypothetical protein